MSTFEPPHTNGALTTSEITKTRSVRRRLIQIAFALFVVAWIIALTYSVTAGGKSPERLDDANAQTVESRCVTAQHDLSALPQLDAKSTIAERADRVSAENRILTTMIDGLRAVHPATKTPTVALTGWLDDWQLMVTARQHYANDLRTKGNAARFLEPTTSGVDPVPDKMNNWILEQGTRTEACNTGELQVEVVEGPRVYGAASKS